MNDAHDMSWWPDWTDRRLVIIGAGPSLSAAQCDVVKATMATDPTLLVIVVNESWRMLPSAHVLYGCDWQWWQAKAPRKDAYSGMRVMGTLPSHGALPHDMKWQSTISRLVPITVGKFRMVWEGPRIGAGGNSVYQALNWAIRCGIRWAALLGVDCHSPQRHWHGVHDHPSAPYQKQRTINNWLRAWKAAEADLIERGVTLINCSPASALKLFPAMPIDEALAFERAA